MGQTLVTQGSYLGSNEESFSEATYQWLKQWCKGAIEEFIASSYCNAWKKRKKSIASLLIHDFVIYAYRYFHVKPSQYNDLLVESLCLDILPRRMTLNPADFKLLTPILSSFFAWLERKGVMSRTRILRDKLHEIEGEIYETAKSLYNGKERPSLFVNLSNMPIKFRGIFEFF